MKRSLIAFQALLASSAVLCQTAEASSTYTAPEQLTGQGKSISQVNFRIGANNDPAATGFSYRISVQGCH